LQGYIERDGPQEYLLKPTILTANTLLILPMKTYKNNLLMDREEWRKDRQILGQI